MTHDTDLRRTLAAHAREVEDLPAVERLAAVHGRVRGVRRRRRATLAGGLAAVVAAVGAVVWLPTLDSPGPASQRHLAGHTAPRSMTSLGFGYSFESGEQGTGSAGLRLAVSDRPRLVSWAGSQGRVRLQTDVDRADPLTPGPADFSDFVYVAPGTPARFRVTGSGSVALAVYDLSAAAPGVTEHGVTWRQDVTGARLLAATTGAPGQNDLTVRFVVPAGGISYGELCATAPKGLWVHVSVDGQGGISGGCETGPAPYDGGATSSSTREVDGADGRPLQPGATATARVWVTRSATSEAVVAAPGVTIGVGVYANPPTAATLGTWRLPEKVEQGGHTYRFQGVRASRPGQLSVAADVTATGTPVLVQTLSSHTERGFVRRYLGDEETTSAYNDTADGGDLSTLGVLVDQTQTVRVVVPRAGPRTVLGIATYTRVG